MFALSSHPLLEKRLTSQERGQEGGENWGGDGYLVGECLAYSSLLLLVDDSQDACDGLAHNLAAISQT